MTAKEAIQWFKTTFATDIATVVAGTPFGVDLIAAIAYQETGYIWSVLLKTGVEHPEDPRALCQRYDRRRFLVAA